MKRLICTGFAVILGLICVACKSESENYKYEDVEISGIITKQYIETNVIGKYAVTSHHYYTIVDYGGDNLKIIEDKDYYQRHNVGDEVELTKHRTYDENGNWIKTEVRWK